MILTAIFIGGPLDGQRRDVEPGQQEYECWTPFPVQDGRFIRETRHVYRRTGDRLRDGAAEFVYTNANGR